MDLEGMVFAIGAGITIGAIGILSRLLCIKKRMRNAPVAATINADCYTKNGDPLGEGTFGKVYSVTDRASDNNFALKLLKSRKIESSDDVIECAILTQLDHDNIVRISKWGFFKEYRDLFVRFNEKVANTRFGMVMELCSTDLQKTLKTRTIIDYGWNSNIMRQVLEGVNYLHLNNVIHRDIKPGNILLTLEDDGNPHVKLTDFGLAKEGDFSVTATQTTCRGTLIYMAPEVCVCRAEYDKSVDVYSLGILVMELFSTREMFNTWAVQRCFQLLTRTPPSCITWTDRYLNGYIKPTVLEMIGLPEERRTVEYCLAFWNAYQDAYRNALGTSQTNDHVN